MSQRLTVNATAYGPPWDAMEGTGITSTGVNLRQGQQKLVVAVDPKVIPYGTKLKIPHNPFGDPNLVFTASDTGGAITGNHLDFFVASGRQDQNRWGRRNITVEVLGKGDPHDVAVLGHSNPRHQLATTIAATKTSTPAAPAAGAPAATQPAQGMTQQDAIHQAILGQLLARPGQTVNPASILASLGNTTQAPEQPTVANSVMRTTGPKVQPAAHPAQVHPGVRNTNNPFGPVIVAPGAERAGHGLQKPILNFLHQLAGVSGREVTVTTGTNHNQYVAGEPGRQSDHWDGNAADLGMGGDARSNSGVAHRGDLVAAHAIQIAGGLSFSKALQMAQRGGVFNFQTHAGRVQVLWKTMTGGNHYNHVHVGLNPNR